MVAALVARLAAVRLVAAVEPVHDLVWQKYASDLFEARVDYRGLARHYGLLVYAVQLVFVLVLARLLRRDDAVALGLRAALLRLSRGLFAQGLRAFAGVVPLELAQLAAS